MFPEVIQIDGNITVTLLVGVYIGANHKCIIMFDKHLSIIFIDDSPHLGDLCSLQQIQICCRIDGDKTVTNKANKASQKRGAIDSYENCYIYHI